MDSFIGGSYMHTVVTTESQIFSKFSTTLLRERSVYTTFEYFVVLKVRISSVDSRLSMCRGSHLCYLPGMKYKFFLEIKKKNQDPFKF